MTIRSSEVLTTSYRLECCNLQSRTPASSNGNNRRILVRDEDMALSLNMNSKRAEVCGLDSAINGQTGPHLGGGGCNIVARLESTLLS